jgi:hypothetical protein
LRDDRAHRPAEQAQRRGSQVEPVAQLGESGGELLGALCGDRARVIKCWKLLRRTLD